MKSLMGEQLILCFAAISLLSHSIEISLIIKRHGKNEKCLALEKNPTSDSCICYIIISSKLSGIKREKPNRVETVDNECFPLFCGIISY